MDTERLGIKLGRLIAETFGESIDDITSTLGRRIEDVFLEYVALLLWIATKEASIVLTDKSFRHASNVAFSVTFDLLEDAGGRKKIKLCGGDFNMKTFEAFIHDRFEIYYAAWKVYPTIGDPLKDAQLGKVSIANNFIVCCFVDEAEYRKLFPNEEDTAVQAMRVLHHYNRFSERVQSILSRY